MTIVPAIDFGDTNYASISVIIDGKSWVQDNSFKCFVGYWILV